MAVTRRAVMAAGIGGMIVMAMRPTSAQPAYQVIIAGSGPGTGLFVYSPSIGAGNLIASIAPTGGTDPFGNPYRAGITDYNTLGVFANLLNGALAVGSQNAGTKITNGALVRISDALAVGTAPFLELLAPLTATGVGAELTLGGASADGSKAARIIAGTNGTTPVTAALMEVSNSLAVSSAAGLAREWYAPSGGDDYVALNTALSGGYSADLIPGTYLLSAQLAVAAATLQGCDMATIIQPFGAYAGSLLAAGAKGAIRNLSVEGSGSDAIQVPGGVAEWWLEDLYFASNTGLCINATPTGPAHGRIRGIRGAGGGAASGGGIAVNGGTGAAVTAEVNISDVDIQGCLTSEILLLSAVTDVLCAGPVNGSIKAGVAANGITVQGSCQSCQLRGLDVGGGSGTGILVFQAAGGNSPNEIDVDGGVVQDGNLGVVVNGGSARLSFRGLMAKRMQTDGWQWNGTGAFNEMHGCGGNLNNQSAGTGYDVNVTSTARLLNAGFKYVSGAVTAGRNLTVAGNHYTEANPPAALTTAGNAPGGW